MHVSQAAGATLAVARKLGTGLAVACLATLILSGSASAATAWMPPQDLSAPGRDATKPAVAMAADGETIVVWERRDDFKTTQNIQVSTRAPGGPFTAPVELAKRAQDPVVAMTPGGEAIAAWWHFRNPPGVYVLQVSSRPPGGSFSAPTDVAEIPSGSSPPALQLAVNAHGGAALAWTRRDPLSIDPGSAFVEVAIRPAGGAFASPLPLTEPVEEETAGEPAVAIDDAGRVTVVWSYVTETERQIEAATTATPGGPFSARDAVSEAGTPASFPDVAAAPGGEIVVIWTEGSESVYVVNVATRDPGGSFGSPDPISDAGEFSSTPELATAGDGSTVALWLNREGVGVFRAETAFRPPGGEFGSPSVISTPGAEAQFPSLASSRSGAVIASWSEAAAAGGQLPVAAVRLPGAAFGAATAIGPVDSNFLHTSAAVADGGDASVVWSQVAGANAVIRVAGFDAGDPVVLGLAAPAQGTVGEPVAASMSAFDVWPSGRSISFGDGAVAPGAAASHTYGAPGTYAITATITDPIGNSASQTRSIQIFASNRFTIRKRHLNRAKGRIRLRIDVAGPGRVVVRGPGILRRQVRAKAAGPVNVYLRTKGKARRQLNRKGRVKTTVRVAFHPDGGPRAERKLKLTFVKKLKKRRR